MALTSLRLSAFLLLTAASAGLAFVIYGEIEDDSAPAAVAPAAAPEPAAMPPPQTFSLPPIQNYHVVTDRPLFTQDRKPAPAAEINSQPATNLSEFVLSGIVITDGEKIALIADAHAGSLARYREGQVVGGWKLRSILQDRVVLERGATQEEIKLTDRSRTTGEGTRQPNHAPVLQVQPQPQVPVRR